MKVFVSSKDVSMLILSKGIHIMRVPPYCLTNTSNDRVLMNFRQFQPNLKCHYTTSGELKPFQFQDIGVLQILSITGIRDLKFMNNLPDLNEWVGFCILLFRRDAEEWKIWSIASFLAM